MRVFKRFKKFPKRQQVLLVGFSVLLIFGIITFIWAAITGKIKPFAAGNTQISNTAYVTYDGLLSPIASNTVLVTVDNPPEPPTGVSATVISSTQVNLRWTPSVDTDVVSYTLYRNNTSVKTGITGTTYSDTGLTAATTYSYQMTAIDGAGNESVKSNTSTVTTPGGVTNPTFNVNLAFSSGTNYSSTGTALRIYNTGTTTKVFEKTDITTSATGSASFPGTALASGNYDYFIKANGYLAKAVRNTPYADPLNLNFGQLKAGDLDGDNWVVLSDFIIFRGKFGQADQIADFDHDGTVTLSDFITLRNNWLQEGDK